MRRAALRRRYGRSSTGETFRLVRVVDLRPVDWVSGKRAPLGAGEGHECDRCGALHAVIYEFLGDRGTRLSVGSTCATKDLALGVTKKELAKREREARAEVETAEERRQIDAVKAFLRTLGPPPEPVEIPEGERPWGKAYGADGVVVHSLEKTLTPERRSAFASAWRDAKLRAAVAFTPGFNNYAIISTAERELRKGR